MAFIGVIAESSKVKYAKTILEKNLNKQKITVFTITDNNIENIRNIKFETIVMTKELKKEEYLKNILRNTKYLIINADMRYNVSVLQNMELTVITYGFNPKSTVTISSIEEENILLCIQRNMQDINRANHRGTRT